MSSAWSGKVLVSLLRAVYVGPVGATRPHAHHAVQLCVPMRGEIVIDHRSFTAAVIPSGAPHGIDGAAHPCVLVYLEPEGIDGQGIRRWCDGRTVAALDGAVASCVRAAVRRTTGSAERTLDAVAAALELAPVRAEPIDPRIRRALPGLRRDSDGRRRLAEVAVSVGLSPSRFRHLFRAQLGIGYRRYLLWQRLLRAVAELARSRTLTEAAHAAGFADSAHLTRTFTAMFGITPSTLRGNVVAVGASTGLPARFRS